jgi:acyl-CoA synthetase (AMP-forming)/AMP-acid ligase II
MFSESPAIGDGPIAHLHYWAKTTPYNVAMVGPNFKITRKELLSNVQNLAGWIRDLGLPKDSAVLVDFLNEYERIYTLVLVHEGIMFTGIPERLDVKELEAAGFTPVLTPVSKEKQLGSRVADSRVTTEITGQYRRGLLIVDKAAGANQVAHSRQKQFPLTALHQVVQVQSFPKNQMGKIIRRGLMQTVKE